MRERKYNILELREYRTNWADVHVDLLDDEQKDIYIKRKQAVDMYIDDIPLNRIIGLSTLFQTNFFRLFSRYCTGV